MLSGARLVYRLTLGVIKPSNHLIDFSLYAVAAAFSANHDHSPIEGLSIVIAASYAASGFRAKVTPVFSVFTVSRKPNRGMAGYRRVGALVSYIGFMSYSWPRVAIKTPLQKYYPLYN